MPPIIVPTNTITDSASLLSPGFVLPRPEALAPCLFNAHAYLPDSATLSSQGNGNTGGNGNTQPGNNNGDKGASGSGANNTGNTGPAQQNGQTDTKQNAEKKSEKAIPDTDKLTPDMVKQINADLQSPEEMVRQNGARTLARAMNNDPDMLTHAAYKDYAQALILKVIQDPSSIVHQPVLLSMSMGNLHHPTPEILKALNELKTKGGLYNFEPAQIADAINAMMQASGPSEPAPPPPSQPQPMPLPASAPSQTASPAGPQNQTVPSPKPQALYPKASQFVPMSTKPVGQSTSVPQANAPGQRVNVMAQ